MPRSLIESRIEYAFRYLKFDSEVKNFSWIESVETFNSSGANTLPELMVLIHPRYLSDYNLENRSVFGPDAFAPARSGVKCRSKEIWGYECPFLNAKIHIDHSFPRSRGGSTTSMNAMYLCEEHNLPKSSDIHLFPWENLPGKIDWVNPILETLTHAELRKSKFRVHFPKFKKKLD
jgi:hypothetical protein